MNNPKQLDSYSLLIASKYFIQQQDYINIMCVCKKFKETTEKLRFNPIPVDSLKLFPKIQTQYLYKDFDKKIEGIDNYEIWYDVDYEYYLKHNNDNIVFHHIKYYDESDEIINEVNIPTVTNMLSEYCFGDYINSILIPSHITSIENHCFDGCYGLNSVTLSNNLTSIPNNCFLQCGSLTSIIIPTSIQFIEKSCFYECDGLQTIDIPCSVKTIGDNCFFDCTSLKSIILPSSIMILETEVFSYCRSLTNIKLPSTLICIRNYCFNSCGIKSIEIPKSVKSIGIGCFNGCTALTNLHFESNTKEFIFEVSYSDSILYNKYNINCINVVLTYHDVVNQLNNTQQFNTKTKDFIIPNSVVKIDETAFRYQDQIQSITIPTTVTSIGNHCFINCKSLTSLLIPKNVKVIGIGCFNECTSLKELSLPLNENNIYPFKVSYSDYLILKQHDIVCSDVVFDYNDLRVCENFPNDIPLIVDSYFNTEHMVFSNSIISVKHNYLSMNITTITIPTTITYLCNECFKNYSKLQSIILPTTVKSIGKHLIDGCTSLTELKYKGDWNNVVVSYNDHLRYKSKGLLFNSIEYTNDDKIKYGNIIPSFIHLLHHSYYDRSNEMMYIPTHITSLDNHMFSTNKYDVISKLQSITIPTSIKTIPKYCFSECYLLLNVELPSTLNSIKKKAFKKCISLQSIIIPTSVIEIGQNAFDSCYSLTSITILTTMKLGIDCFKHCYQLNEILNTGN